jgi:hypothetical protein
LQLLKYNALCSSPLPLPQHALTRSSHPISSSSPSPPFILLFIVALDWRSFLAERAHTRLIPPPPALRLSASLDAAVAAAPDCLFLCFSASPAPTTARPLTQPRSLSPSRRLSSSSFSSSPSPHPAPLCFFGCHCFANTRRCTRAYVYTRARAHTHTHTLGS